MKKRNKIFLIILTVFVCALAFPYSVSAAPVDDDRIVFGESYTLESGRILDGDLILIGGVIDIQSGAVVRGDIFALGSVGNINGTIEGDLIAIGGTVTLSEDALIIGNIFSPTSIINELEGAVVEGDIYEGWSLPWPENMSIPTITVPEIRWNTGFRLLPSLTRIAQETAKTMIMVALGAFLLLIMPKHTEVMIKALLAKPWQMLAYGAITALVMLVGGLILTITICLIPVAILAGLVVGLAALAGWLTLGYELGKRIAATIFKSSWHPVLSAVVGNFVLYLTTLGLTIIPCLGDFLIFLVALFGLGLSVVTLFGTKPFPHDEAGINEQVVLSTSSENIDENTLNPEQAINDVETKKE